MTEATMANPAFPDIVGHKYQPAIQACAEHGLVLGRDDGLFHPDDPMTRGEFCEAMARTYLPQATINKALAAGLSWQEIVALVQLGLAFALQIPTTPVGQPVETPIPVHVAIGGERWALVLKGTREA